MFFCPPISHGPSLTQFTPLSTHCHQTLTLFSPPLKALTLLRVANLDFAWWASAAHSSSSPLWGLKGLRSLDMSGNYRCGIRLVWIAEAARCTRRVG